MTTKPRKKRTTSGLPGKAVAALIRDGLAALCEGGRVHAGPAHMLTSLFQVYAVCAYAANSGAFDISLERAKGAAGDISSPLQCLAISGSNQAYRAISTSQLKALPLLHLWPIDVVVFHGPQGDLVLKGASRLDAFSGYPVRT
jgi:hypothetical protein